MKGLFTFLLVPLAFLANAQDLYDLNTVQDIQITFAESNWDQLLDAQKAGDEDYILAQSVSINGTVFDSVGVKYKGNSTYKANQTKNPFHIELDTYKDHDYQGYKDIKLSNVANDPSFLREVLSYQVLRQYMDAPLSNYANVTVNGQLIGLYSNSEAISKTFIDDRFGSKDNTFIKCNPINGAGPQSTSLPDLTYLGQDSTDYYSAYELKSDDGWQDLIDLCDTLANESDKIEQILDVDRALWMHAFNNVLVNLDSYSGQFTQNYYLYRDNYGRFIPVVWDLNESFGRFSMTGSGNLNSTTAKQRMSHLLHENDSQFPLIQKLLANPTYKRMYIAHCKTMLTENFDDQSYLTTAVQLQSTIDEHVQADVNKFFTYQNFIDNLENDISGGGPGGPGGGGTVGIANLMDGRNDYLLGLSDFADNAPSITDIETSDDNPVIGESIIVTADISDAELVLLGYRTTKRAPFTKVEMLDDGLHGDGAANDGIYGVEIELSGAEVQYYIYAENDDAGLFSPRRAEYEYHNITASAGNPQLGDLVINELMASNDVTVVDPDGEYEDWIELYNNGTSSIDLFGYSLSDDPEDVTQWSFPEGTEIAAGGYLIIWADNDEDQEGLHASFKLSASGESVILADANGVVIDEVIFEEQETDFTYGRFPNGTGDFKILSPTFGTVNMDVLAVSVLAEGALDIYPVPAGLLLNITTDASQVNNATLVISDQIGHEVYRNTVNNDLTTVDVQQWPNGIYFVQYADQVRKVIIQH